MGMGRSGRRVIAVLAISGLGLTLTACGGDDDDDAAPAATDNADNNNDNADNNDNGGGSLSDDCKDALSDYFKKLEPFIKDIDWQNANADTMGSIDEEMGDKLDDEDAKVNKECGEFDFTDPDQLQGALDVAKDDAPGAVAFLTFLQTLSQAVSNISVPDVTIPDITLPDDVTIPDVTIPDVTVPNATGASAADLPTDCDGAIEYMKGLMDKYDTMGDMPIAELSTVGTVTGVITSTCSVNKMTDFYNDPDMTAWMSAG